MNYSYTVAELCQVLQGRALHIFEQLKFEQFAIDSRKIRRGDLFFALSGEKTDGHLYIQQALDNGAQGVIACEKRLTPELASSKFPWIVVKDPNQALLDLAQDYRKRFTQGQVLGITGSNGKTSSKEIAAEICRSLGVPTHATQGNFNNYVGVPLTLLSATLQEAWWIVEMGTNRFGEIATLSEVVQPDLGLITNIGESHLEFLENTQGVAQEKSGLFAGMAPHAIAAMPANLLHQEVIVAAAVQSQIQLVTYGFDHWNLPKPADYSANLQALSPTQAKFEWLGQTFETPIGNALLLSNLLGILTLLHCNGTPLGSLSTATQKLSYAIKGRMQFRQMPSFLLVDDTYNANPTSFKSVITTLKEMYPHRRLIVVAGAMAELGAQSPAFHWQTGRHLQKIGVAQLLAFGDNEARFYGEGWQTEGGVAERSFWTKDFAELLENFEKILQKEDVVLVKGSRSAQMERFVQAIIA